MNLFENQLFRKNWICYSIVTMADGVGAIFASARLWVRIARWISCRNPYVVRTADCPGDKFCRLMAGPSQNLGYHRIYLELYTFSYVGCYGYMGTRRVTGGTAKRVFELGGGELL